MNKIVQQISGSGFLIALIVFRLLNFLVIDFLNHSENNLYQITAIVLTILFMVFLFYIAKSRIKRVYGSFKVFLLFYCLGQLYTTFISGSNEYNLANSNGMCDGFDAYSLVCMGLFFGLLLDLTILVMNCLLVFKNAKTIT